MMGSHLLGVENAYRLVDPWFRKPQPSVFIHMAKGDPSSAKIVRVFAAPFVVVGFRCFPTNANEI